LDLSAPLTIFSISEMTVCGTDVEDEPVSAAAGQYAEVEVRDPDGRSSRRMPGGAFEAV
jgi:hypothetical protein